MSTAAPAVDLVAAPVLDAAADRIACWLGWHRGAEFTASQVAWATATPKSTVVNAFTLPRLEARGVVVRRDDRGWRLYSRPAG